MKFKDMPYERIPIDEAREVFARHLAAFQSADSVERALEAYHEYELYYEHVITMFSLSFIHNSLDTTDPFFAGEKAYWDETDPLLQELTQNMLTALVHSPHRQGLEQKMGCLIFTNAEMEMKTFSPAVIADLQEENRLTTEYDKLLSSAQIEYEGKTYTLAQLAPFFENPDRAVRKASFEARAEWFLLQAGTLDRIFDDLVKVRTAIAHKLGFENFIELGYLRMQRNCYDQSDVEKFRLSVLKNLVPVAAGLKTEQAGRIGVQGKLKLYDDPCEFTDGNATPVGTPEEIFAHGKKMYHEMSPQTAEFIDMMLENELFDVLTRRGKSPGGYCDTLPDYKVPFIFANFNGTSGDIDVLTHEAGHAFADYQARDVYPAALRHPTYEACEVHSMSMEFFAWPWMEGFFGGKVDKYRYAHLSGALTFVPYGTIVDAFQHIVYARPDMTPAQRNEAWLELEAQYRPWLDMTDTPFYEQGRRWQGQGHIFQRAFYYIDYCLAQTVALEFWAAAQKDRRAAWEKYMRFVSKAGTQTLLELIETAEMESPFESKALETVAAEATLWLNQNKLG